ncbi:hypothetical protein [Streptomyces sp. NRRL F-5123]|uniref:hypothetical protein n=1 Tax=Streptomyces sp. NRRL F-5123 TaxID=1463856 RepID=UPI00099B5C80|nr:hypothetical protein [Streptomyces sp. NRRL F-5123]
MKITRTVVAVIGGFAAFTLAACGPAGTTDAGSAATLTPTATASTITTAPAPTTTTEPATISPSPTTPPATTTTPPAPKKTAAPKRTTARPAVRHTTAPAKKTLCSIRSNAGNCYKAGQFCRNADLGATTTDANGRDITCETVSGKPHWRY